MPTDDVFHELIAAVYLTFPASYYRSEDRGASWARFREARRHGPRGALPRAARHARAEGEAAADGRRGPEGNVGLLGEQHDDAADAVVSFPR